MKTADTVIAVFADHHPTKTVVKELTADVEMKTLSVIRRGYHADEKVVDLYNMGDRGAALNSIAVPKDSGLIQHETAVKTDSFLVMAHGPAVSARAKTIFDTAAPSSPEVHTGVKRQRSRAISSMLGGNIFPISLLPPRMTRTSPVQLRKIGTVLTASGVLSKWTDLQHCDGTFLG